MEILQSFHFCTVLQVNNFHLLSMDIFYDFQIKNQITYELAYDFSMEQFIDFMMVQSNVNIKLESGAVNEKNARDWLEKSLTPVFENREKTLYFKGYNWYIYKLG